MTLSFRHFVHLAAVGALSFASACSVCTSIAVTSVVVEVSDETGALVSGADVRYEWDGVESPCESNLGSYACGYENEGDTIIRVNLDGYAPYEQVVSVPADDCHVETQQLNVELTPL